VGVDAEAVRFDLRDLYATAAAGDREAAMGFYAGDFLPGFHVESAPAFEEWIASQRAAARIFALETTESLAREAAEAERARDAVRWARRAVEIAPDEERVVRLLMELLAASGDRTAALDAYRSLESRLAAEYGDTPSARTDALACELRRAELPSAAGRLADPSPSRPASGRCPR
jgi:DNA-binding SARP family transcriptional activator